MAQTILPYDNFLLGLGRKIFDFADDTFKIILVSSTYSFSYDHAVLADIAGELTDGHGYTVGGQAISGVSFEVNDHIAKFDAEDVTWSALGGTIGPMTGAIVYDNTTVDKRLLFYQDFGGEQSAGDSIDFRVIFDSSGVLSISQI